MTVPAWTCEWIRTEISIYWRSTACQVWVNMDPMWRRRKPWVWILQPWSIDLLRLPGPATSVLHLLLTLLRNQKILQHKFLIIFQSTVTNLRKGFQSGAPIPAVQPIWLAVYML